MTHKPLVFIGDIHGNAQALTQILNIYPQEYYFLVWSGDFINSKKPVTDKEIEYVLYMMLTNCRNVLYSNHMHLMYKYLTAPLNNTSQNPSFNGHWPMWAQTKRVLENLPSETKRQLIEHCKQSYFCIHYQNNIMAHAFPHKSLINKTFTGLLDLKRKKTIGVGKDTNLFWLNPCEEITSLAEEFDRLIIGHHGLVIRHDNIRVIDLKGIQVPVWEAETDNIKIFPL